MYKDKRTSIWWTSYRGQQGIRVRSSLGTTFKAQAQRYEAMIHEFAARHEWRSLDLWQKGVVDINTLYTHYTAGTVMGLHFRAAAKDLTPMVDTFLQQGCRGLAKDTVDHYRTHLATFFQGPVLSSELTRARITAWLNRLPASIQSGTRRKYAMAMKAFVAWLLRAEVLDADPMAGIVLPKAGNPRVEYLDQESLVELLNHAPPKYRDALVVAYGTGAEASALVQIQAQDIDEYNRSIRIRGTKNGYRDRWVRVADFAWPTVLRLKMTKGKTGGRIFHFKSRHTISRAHLVAARAIGRDGLHLHDARHTFAVRLLKAGAPPRLVAEQLGHADEQMVLKHYGTWISRHEERDRHEQKAVALFGM